MHTDGDGGCVHAHATIVNHDVRTGLAINKGDTSLYAPRVQAVNDELSRANGLQVLGTDKSHTTWEERSATLDAKSFDRHLGDKIAYARDNADSMEAFKKNLEYGGVTLTETTKTDKKTGEVTSGWSYKAKDVWGPKMRTRKRRASKLCDEFTKEGIEAYFEEKQAQQSEILSVESEVRPVQTEQTPVERRASKLCDEFTKEGIEAYFEEKQAQQSEILSVESEVRPVQTEQTPVESEHTREQSEFAATPVIAEAQEPETPHEAFHVYEPDIGDMYDMVGDLRRAYVKHCIGKGQKDYMDKTYRMFLEVEDEPDQTYHDLRAEVQLARDAFYESKAELEAMKEQRRNFAISMAIFRSVNRQSKSPLVRMMSDMYAMMFRQMLQAQREEAERKLYERRREMWDAEKALKNELKRGEIGYKPHEMPAHLQRIVDGFGKDRDDEKSLGDW